MRDSSLPCYIIPGSSCPQPSGPDWHIVCVDVVVLSARCLEMPRFHLDVDSDDDDDGENDGDNDDVNKTVNRRYHRDNANVNKTHGDNSGGRHHQRLVGCHLINKQYCLGILLTFKSVVVVNF